MTRKHWIITISTIVSLLLVLSNPSQEDHRQALKGKFIESIQEKLANQPETTSEIGETFGVTMATAIIANMVDATVTRNNWVLFSTTEITIEGKSKTIGVGILGHVYLSSKVDEALSEGLNK
jgi:ATP-dependent Lon protease